MPTCCGMHVKFPNKELSVDHLLFCTLSVCKYLTKEKKDKKRILTQNQIWLPTVNKAIDNMRSDTHLHRIHTIKQAKDLPLAS